MQPISETRRIQSALKPLLKKRGYSYPELARSLNVSLPTVKRMLTKDDLSIERLSRICAFIGISLHEFLDLTRTARADLYFLSPSEEQFFAKNPSYLYYLFALHNERKTPREIEKICGISPRSTQKYLNQLSEMKLIRVLPNGRAKVRIQGMIGWDDHGLLGRSISHEMIRGITERNLSGTAEESYLELSGRMLSESEYASMKREFGEIVAKYRRISKVNSASEDLSKTRRYNVVIIAERRSDQNFRRISELR